MAYVVEGSVRHATLRKGRVYLFPGAEQQNEFKRNPKQYDDSDLAADGNCVVCQSEKGLLVKGRREFTALHRGLRYLFPGDAQRKMFLANPTKYASADRKTTTNSTKLTATKNEIAFLGNSGCAACEHGKRPIGAPSQLGLAVNAADGHVFIIEDAHNSHPEIYAKRFDQLSLSVSGSVIRTDGKFSWINPSEIKVVN